MSRPADDARIFHLELDPLEQQMPLWRIAAEGSWRADAFTALTQIDDWLAAQPIDADLVVERKAHHAAAYAERAARLQALEAEPKGTLTPEYAVGLFRTLMPDDVMIMSESISS